MPIEKALSLSEPQLHVFYNEACRQRAIDLYHLTLSQDTKKALEEVQKCLKIHGQYTEGFQEAELERLRLFLNGGANE